MSSGDSSRFLRATTLAARTIYRELHRAGYGREDVLRFASELVEQLTIDSRQRSLDLPLHVDTHTALPNADVFEHALSFELHRARRPAAHGTLVVAVFEIVAGAALSDGQVLALHAAFADELRRNIRRSDTAARLSHERYGLILPRTTESTLEAVRRRIADSLRHRISPSALRHHVTLTMQATTLVPGDVSTKDLMQRCARARRIPLSGDVSKPSHRDGLPSAQRGVVLALGGGAARALAHLGVIQVLQEAGIRIAGVAGTSAGAIMAAMVAGGASVGDILQRWQELPKTDLYRKIRRAFAVSATRQGRSKSRDSYFRESSIALLSDASLSAVPRELYTELVEFLVGPDRLISQLQIPFAASATDLTVGRVALLRHGPLHSALRASCAFPGLFPPEPLGDSVLVDGAAISELPVRAALELSRALQAPALGVYLSRPERRVTSFQTGAELAVRTNAIMHAELVREQLRDMPLVITVSVQDVGWLNLRAAGDTVKLGAAAAREALPAIRLELESLAQGAISATAT
jgi:NTE family protein